MRRLIIATAAVSMLLPATAFAQAVGGLLSSDSNNPTVQVSAPGTYSSPHQLLAIELSPVVTVQSEATADPGESFQPSGGVTYSYTVAGAPNVFVPVSILYNLQTSAGGYSSGAYAYLSTTLYSADGTLLPATVRGGVTVAIVPFPPIRYRRSPGRIQESSRGRRRQ